jgi:hypothetical protein
VQLVSISCKWSIVIHTNPTNISVPCTVAQKVQKYDELVASSYKTSVASKIWKVEHR